MSLAYLDTEEVAPTRGEVAGATILLISLGIEDRLAYPLLEALDVLLRLVGVTPDAITTDAAQSAANTKITAAKQLF